MNVFRADSGHLGQLAVLFDQYRQFYEQPADLGACRQFIGNRMANNESVVFAAETGDGSMLGFTQLYHSFCSVDMIELIYLYDLYVVPDARRQGVGRALMDAARQYAVDRGAGRLQLETAVDNKPAQALYESLGWKRDKKFYTYHLQPE